MNSIRNKWLAAALGILIVINIVTLASIWLTKPRLEAPSPPPPPSAADFIIAELNFDKSQQQKYKELIREHRHEIRVVREGLRPLKDSFFDSVGDSLLSEQEVADVANKIGDKEKEIDLATFRHFRKVRALCNPVQKQKFDQIVRQVIKMTAPPPPPPIPSGEKHGIPPPPPVN